MKYIRLLSIFAWKFAKNMSAKQKSKKTPNTQRQKGFDEKKIKITKENRGQQNIKPEKMY